MYVFAISNLILSVHELFYSSTFEPIWHYTGDWAMCIIVNYRYMILYDFI